MFTKTVALVMLSLCCSHVYSFYLTGLYSVLEKPNREVDQKKVPLRPSFTPLIVPRNRLEDVARIPHRSFHRKMVIAHAHRRPITSLTLWWRMKL
ncbi:hypothetical protein QR680_010121 [Steinernema hermaphroditum]|uniref:Uncharacterized protein n=1 Tax=Steinernema hermaphroditum TaxID=289476 RepID=A0AA39IQA2_9BILA|nr:hypothetical protein QR680_010121 [Steinernema hermaphroditum]